MGWLDLRPDGRFERNPSLGMFIDPSQVLPPLPFDAQAQAAGWSIETPFSTVHYTASNDQPKGDFVMTTRHESDEEQIYLINRSSTIRFDRQKGLVSSIQSHTSQDFGMHGKGDGSLSLASIETKDSKWMAQLDEEATSYFNASRIADEKHRAASKDLLHFDALWNEAEKALGDARAITTLAPLTAALDADLKSHQEALKYAKDEAVRWGGLRGNPAPQWKLTDLAGASHALSNYKGKVVVLDFWYRGCGWCIRAMPQINRLSQDLKDQGVVVFGMNTDPDKKDAAFVAEKMNLKYPTLLAGNDMATQHQVRGFPTLLIIDGDGIVRDIHVGYSPTLYDEVAASIHAILEPAKSHESFQK